MHRTGTGTIFFKPVPTCLDGQAEGWPAAAADPPGSPGGGLRGRHPHTRAQQPHLGSQNQVMKQKNTIWDPKITI